MLFLCFLLFTIFSLLLEPSVGLCVEKHLNNRNPVVQAPSKNSLVGLSNLAKTLGPVFAANVEQEDSRNKGFENKKRFTAPPPRQVDPGVPRIALLLPLTGQHAKLGHAMLNAAQLALFHFADKQFELLPHDTRGTESGALDAVSRAIGDGASLILGPLFAGSVAAVAPAARAAGVKIIAFSSDRNVAGDGVFTMGFLPREQVRRVVSYAISQGVRRFAVLAPNNDYGLTIVNALRQTIYENGMELVQKVFYDGEVSNFHPIIKKLADYEKRRRLLLDERSLLKARDDEVAKLALKRLENLQTMGDVSFEALLIAEGGKALQSIAALLPYYDLDPKKIRMLGTSHWDISGIGSEPALVGGWFAAPPSEGRREFTNQYTSIYGEPPPRLATLAYDATALSAVFTQSDHEILGEAPRSFYKLSTIAVPHGFRGLDGIFRFVPAGFVERGLSVFQVGKRKNKTISPAPEKFEGGFN